VCIASRGAEPQAIELLKRAAEGGFAAFWCAYHLGLFEMRRGRPANAATYYAMSLILEPARDDILPLLDRVAPQVERGWLVEAQRGVRSMAAAEAALAEAEASAADGRFGAAAFYGTIALALDPGSDAARTRLRQWAPEVSLTLLRDGGAETVA